MTLLAKGRGEAEGLNLVALGDQSPEIQAARNIGRLIGESALVKTVKLSEFPSVGELLGQLCRLECDLGGIVRETTSGSRALVSRLGGGASSDVSSRASGWQCVAAEDEPPWDFKEFTDAC